MTLLISLPIEKTPVFEIKFHSSGNAGQYSRYSGKADMLSYQLLPAALE
jgi:hypothetical protein